MNRRHFLAAASASAALIASRAVADTAPAASGPTPTGKGLGKLRISAQEHLIPGKTVAEKVEMAIKLGLDGIEFRGGGLPGRVAEIQKAFAGAPIGVSATCAGFEGWLIAEDEAIRRKCVESLKKLLEASGAIGSTGVIYVPAFNGQKSLPDRAAREALTGFGRWDRRKDWSKEDKKPLLVELGEHAATHQARLLLEPLNRDETYFVRTLAEGASICHDLQMPGVQLMGDMWHMTWEETSDYAAFISGKDYLHHVHMASRKRRQIPTADGAADNYVEGFRALKEIGYQNFVSFECGMPGDPKELIPKAIAHLRGQWEQAG